MITSTNLTMLRNLEHFQVMSNVLIYLKNENLEALKLADFSKVFEEKLKTYDDVLVLERGNILSAKLSDADKKRDNALRSLLNIIKSYTVYPDTEKADAALKLQSVIEKYGKSIDRLPYLEESGVLVNLLGDLETTGNKALITLLHLDEWLTILKSAAAEFDRLFINRETDNSTKLSGQVKQTRQAMQELFQNLATLINAYTIVYGAENYTNLCSKINEAVTYARDQVARRGPRKKEDEKNDKEVE